MKGRERVRIAMSGGSPDCVPVIPQICVPHAVRMLGLDFTKTLLNVVRDPLRMNRLTFQCARLYGVDGVRAWMPAPALDVVETDDGAWYGADPKSGQRLGRVDFAGGGGVLPPEKPTIRDDDDIERLIVPSVDEVLGSGRLDGIREIIREAGDDFFVISAPRLFTVEHLTFMRGKEQAMMDLMDRPDFCHRLLEKSLQIAIREAHALARIGIHGLMIADVFGGVVSPAHFREFCLPYFQRFVDAVRGLGPLVYLHICGNSTRILEMMADTGVNCIEPLDPLGGVDVADAKRRVGSRVALMGGVNTVKLAHGTLQEVMEDCRRCLRGGAEGGGYILACGDMLPTETLREKVQAMIATARGWRYDDETAPGYGGSKRRVDG